MCGRIFLLFQDKFQLFDKLKKDFGKDTIDLNEFVNYSGPNYNVTPTTRIPVVDGDYKLRLIHWGFHLGSMPGIIINARNEECESKRSFKDLIDSKRCIVACSGYYEWHTKPDGKKIPHSFRPKSVDEIFYLAALYKPSADSVVLVTREAVNQISHIHTRMPVILTKEDVAKWLDHKNHNFKDLQLQLITEESYTDPKKIVIETTTLAPHVNSIKNSGPECLQSLKNYNEQSFAKGIGKFFPKTKMAKLG